MAGSYVGLDIGSNLIKVVEVKKSGDRIELLALGVAPTPQEAYENSIIVDAQLLGQEVKKLLKQSGIRSNRCISSVSGQSAVVVRVIEVPQMNAAELAETMKWEVERHVPFAANEVIMDYQPIERPEGVPEGQNMEVLLAVAQEDMIRRHVEMLFAAGLKPTAIDVEPLAVARTLLEVGQTQALPPGHTVAIVNIGASNTDVGIFRDKLLAFPRTMPVAGDNLTRAIADTLQVDLATAEGYKRDYAEVILDQFANQQGFDNPGFGPMPGFVDFGAPAADPSAAPTSSDMFDLGSSPGGIIMPGQMAVPQDSGRLSGGGTSSPSGKMPFDFSTPPNENSVPSYAPVAPFTTPAAAVPSLSPTPFDLSADPTTPAPHVGLNGQSTGDQGFIMPETPSAFVDPGGFQPLPFAPTSAFGAPNPMLPVPISADPNEGLRLQIWGAIAPVLTEIVQELRRSLDYYRGRAADTHIDAILLVGGTARLKNLAPFLEREVGIPTSVADSLLGMHVTSKQHSAEHLSEISSLFPISIGLAARDLLPGAANKGKKRR